MDALLLFSSLNAYLLFSSCPSQKEASVAKMQLIQKKVGMASYGTKVLAFFITRDGLKRGMTSVITIQYLSAYKARASF